MEEATARQLGAEKMQQLVALSEEWDAIFWREIRHLRHYGNHDY